MKKLYAILCLFFLVSMPIFAEENISYQIVDIGVLQANESRAFAVNDAGQVLGKIKIHDEWDFFLWDMENGLQILNFPEDSFLSLNNKGQIAGACSKGIFIWDANKGFYYIGTFDYIFRPSIQINDKGQLLMYEYQEPIYLWNDAVKVNLIEEFYKHFPEYPLNEVRYCSINNRGDVIIHVGLLRNNSTIYKCFQWSNGSFKELFTEFGANTNVHVTDFDDKGNMIVELSNHETPFYGTFFINPSQGLQAKLEQFNYPIIRNNAPQMTYCLPSKPKQRPDGTFYYYPGAEIRKLMKESYPYWFDKNDFRIKDQNSNGWVVGHSETVFYRTRHAFLAIPIK